MLDRDMGQKGDNVLADYAKINSDYQDTDLQYEELSTWFHHESDFVLQLNNNIKLHVISSETFDNYDTYPEVFQNNFKFINDKFTLFLKYETMVMNKTQIISLERSLPYLCSYDETIDLCKKYNLNITVSPLSYYLVEGMAHVIPVVVCNNDQIALLGKRFTNKSKEYIVSEPFPVKIREKDYDIYIDTERRDFFDECGDLSCPINELAFVLKVKHFHSHAILADHNSKYLLPPANTKGVREYSDRSKYFTKLTVFEYQNIGFFKNYGNINTSTDIDFKNLDGLTFFKENNVPFHLCNILGLNSTSNMDVATASEDW
jgi:hypothetical protein